MKTILKLCVFLFSIFSLQAQELSGYWLGTLNVQGQSLRIAFNITYVNGKYITTMDSPDQKAKGIPTNTISMVTDHIEVKIPNMGVVYKGKHVSPKTIDGIFSQAGLNLELNLNKQDNSVLENLRPQTPTKPFPYSSEDINFNNPEANINLAGTFTKPNKLGEFQTVILISGSGPQNRDEEIMDHKPFLVLSDYLTKQGYAVLRFDDRGTYASEGDFSTSTSLDFATDVEAAIDYLKTRDDVDKSKIGLIGHSEGGVIAPLVASERSDVAFIILLAGTGVPGKTIIVDQIFEINKANGESEEYNLASTEISKLSFDYLESILDKADKKDLLTTYMSELIKTHEHFILPQNISSDQFIKSQVEQLCSPWMSFFLFYNPQDALTKTTCPTLAINGNKDLQVKSSLNLPAIEKALQKNGNTLFKTKELDGLNHLFQECKTGSPNEYEQIKQTFSPLALSTISDWMSSLNL